MGIARDLAERWFRDLGANGLARMDDYISPDCVITMPGAGAIDRDTLRGQVLPGFQQAFPNMVHTIEEVIEQGDTAVLRVRVDLPHEGPLTTPDGTEIPATGRTAHLDACDVVTVADGRITSWTSVFDQLSMLQQLGLLPEPSAPAPSS